MISAIFLKTRCNCSLQIDFVITNGINDTRPVLGLYIPRTQALAINDPIVFGKIDSCEIHTIRVVRELSTSIPLNETAWLNQSRMSDLLHSNVWE